MLNQFDLVGNVARALHCVGYQFLYTVVSFIIIIRILYIIIHIA